MSDYAACQRREAPLDEVEIMALNAVLVKHAARWTKRAPSLARAQEPSAPSGVGNVSALDGYLTAVVSAPELIPSSVWMPGIWGDFPPDFAATDDFASVLDLVTRHSHSIARVLMEAPEHFYPLVISVPPIVSGTEERLWLAPWCEGYLHAHSVAPDCWKGALELLEHTLAPIHEVATLPAPTDADFTDQAPHLAPVAAAACQVHALHVADHHTAALGSAAVPIMPNLHDDPPVGHDDPCPCGSGKRYKRCCLH